MIPPALLLRVGIDWVRHNSEYKDSNPYSRCEAVVKVCTKLWQESVGHVDPAVLEPAIVTAYWEEFFHADDPLADENEWRDGLSKRSAQYDKFEDWQEWFKTSYAKVYKENNIWTGVLMIAWAKTHQYVVRYRNESWEFLPATSYLPTAQLWRLYPHLNTVAEVLRDCWQNEVRRYEEAGFSVSERNEEGVGKVECLGFDSKRHLLTWPALTDKVEEEIKLGNIVADIVLPPGDSWYRHPDNVIFAHDCVDITSLINRANYVFGSKRRFLELSIENTAERARIQATAEGWIVDEAEEELDSEETFDPAASEESEAAKKAALN